MLARISLRARRGEGGALIPRCRPSPLTLSFFPAPPLTACSNIVALAFRLSPGFLPADYPERPFGVFYIIGAEFRGFHVRFQVRRGWGAVGGAEFRSVHPWITRRHA